MLTLESNLKTEKEWIHHCTLCGFTFAACTLSEPCPRCEESPNYDTRSLNWYLDEFYGTQPASEWLTIIALEDFTSCVDSA